MSMDVYIKPLKKVLMYDRDMITVKDVTDVIATKKVADSINGMKLFGIDRNVRKCYLVSVTDIIKVIKKQYPDCTVNNVGEMDTFIDYAPEKSVDNSWLKWAKVLSVSIVLFVGSATAIMSFYADGQISQVFENVHKILMGTESKNPLILEVPYAFGLAFGILLFFNHFLGKKITNDPTPIEVQISLYETQVNDAMIDILDVEKTDEDSK
jgi:stage V sporulation protein AA